MALPHLYTDLAAWWPLLSNPADYAEEAGNFAGILRAALPEARTLLELGSGGGNNASFLKHQFEMTLVDRAPGMLAVSQRINPSLPHHTGDMRSVRLDQVFDAVFIHDAICYMTSESDLLAAFATAYAHLRPGGVALFVPDFVRETFHPGTSSGGEDGETLNPPIPGRALRYLEWTFDPDPNDSTYICDFAYLLREGTQQVQSLYDRHINGLFSRDTWLRLMAEAGFVPQVGENAHSEVPYVSDLFIGRKE